MNILELSNQNGSEMIFQAENLSSEIHTIHEISQHFSFVNTILFDEKFKLNPMVYLHSNDRYLVRILFINEGTRVKSEEVLEFVKSRGYLFLNAWGLLEIYMLFWDRLPLGKWLVALDEKRRLWKTGDLHGVPRVYRYSKTNCMLDLGRFEHDWNSDHCIVCLERKPLNGST